MLKNARSIEKMMLILLCRIKYSDSNDFFVRPPCQLTSNKKRWFSLEELLEYKTHRRVPKIAHVKLIFILEGWLVLILVHKLLERCKKLNVPTNPSIVQVSISKFQVGQPCYRKSLCGVRRRARDWKQAKVCRRADRTTGKTQKKMDARVGGSILQVAKRQMRISRAASSDGYQISVRVIDPDGLAACPLGLKTRFSRSLSLTPYFSPPNWGFKWDYLLASAAIFAPAGISACGSANRRALLSLRFVYFFSQRARGGGKPLRESPSANTRRRRASADGFCHLPKCIVLSLDFPSLSLCGTNTPVCLFIVFCFLFHKKERRTFALKYHEIRTPHKRDASNSPFVPISHFKWGNNVFASPFKLACEWCLWHWQWVAG
jgi:hypothetical protein